MCGCDDLLFPPWNDFTFLYLMPNLDTDCILLFCRPCFAWVFRTSSLAISQRVLPFRNAQQMHVAYKSTDLSNMDFDAEIHAVCMQ